MRNDLANKKILVTGGTGFIGRAVVRELIKGGISPTVLTRESEAERLPASWFEKVGTAKIDLLEPEAIRIWLEREKPDVVFHLAGTTGRGDAAGDLCHRLNFLATANLCDVLAKIGCERLILLGSADGYGHRAGAQSENLPSKPVSPYAISKAQATEYALGKFREENLNAVVVRVFTAYGAEQPPFMFVAEAINCALENRIFRMSAGTQQRDLIFIEDAVRALLLAAATTEIAGKIINVGSGKATPLRNVARLIWKISEADENLLKIGELTATTAQNHDTWADISLARKLLKWQPTISLEEGLRRTIEEKREQLKNAATEF
jgi:UDP-glucose 4-epimerase